MPIRSALLASLAVTVGLAGGAPAAHAAPFPAFPVSAFPIFPTGGGEAVASPCTRPSGPSGQGTGNVGEVHNQVCEAGGLTFVGPAIGQIATVIGPTIIGPAVIGNSVVSAGDVSAGY
jgi:hypothetical protein